jgi:hypothetical protein
MFEKLEKSRAMTPRAQPEIRHFPSYAKRNAAVAQILHGNRSRRRQEGNKKSPGSAGGFFVLSYAFESYS